MKLTISGNANIQAHITRISEEYTLLPETDMLAELWKQNVSILRELLSSPNASRTHCVYIQNIYILSVYPLCGHKRE